MGNIKPTVYVGLTNRMNCGDLATVIVYRNHKDIDVQFGDNTVVKHRTSEQFKKGNIKNPNSKTETFTKKCERLGITRSYMRNLICRYNYDYDKLSGDERIDLYYKLIELENRLKQECDNKHINFTSLITWCTRTNRNIDLKSITEYTEYSVDNIKYECEKHNVTYGGFLNYCHRNKIKSCLSNLKQYIKHKENINNKDKLIAELECKYKIDRKTVKQFCKNHKIIADTIEEQFKAYQDYYNKLKQVDIFTLNNVNKGEVNRFARVKGLYDLTDEQKIDTYIKWRNRVEEEKRFNDRIKELSLKNNIIDIEVKAWCRRNNIIGTPEYMIESYLNRSKTSKKIIKIKTSEGEYTIDELRCRLNITTGILKLIKREINNNKNIKAEQILQKWIPNSTLNNNGELVLDNIVIDNEEKPIIGKYTMDEIIDKALEYNIDVKALLNKIYSNKNKNLDEIAVSYLHNTRFRCEKTLKELCKEAGITYTTAKGFHDRNKETSYYEVIMYYKPDCYINLLGELVIPKE